MSTPNTSSRPCFCCDGAGCGECSGTGQRVTTSIEVDGQVMVVHGNAPLDEESVAALAAVGRAALTQMGGSDGAVDDL